MSGRGDRGGHRGGRGCRRKIVEIRLVAAVDHVDRVVDGPLHHREVQDRYRGRLSGVRHWSVRYVHERLDRVLVPVEHRVLRRSRLGRRGRAPEKDCDKRDKYREASERHRPRGLWSAVHIPSPFVTHLDGDHRWLPCNRLRGDPLGVAALTLRRWHSCVNARILCSPLRTAPQRSCDRLFGVVAESFR